MKLRLKIFRDILIYIISFILHRVLNQYKKIAAEESKDCTNSFIMIFELLYIYRIRARITEDTQTISIENIYSHWRYKKPATSYIRNFITKIEDLR